MEEIRNIEKEIDELYVVLTDINDSLTDDMREEKLDVYREKLDELEKKAIQEVNRNIARCEELTRLVNDSNEIDVNTLLEELTKDVVKLDGINKRVNDKNSKYNIQADENRIVDDRLKYSLKELRSKLITIKKVHIMKYNSLVRNTNKKIEELKNEATYGEILDSVNKLELLDEKNINVIRYNQYRYLYEIDVNKIKNTENIIEEINIKQNKIVSFLDELDKESERIENDLIQLEDEYKTMADNMGVSSIKVTDLDSFKNKITNFSNLELFSFRTKLVGLKNKIGEDKYNKIDEFINDAEDRLSKLKLSRLYETKKNIFTSKRELKDELEDLSIQTTDFINNNITRFGNIRISSEMADLFDKELDEFYNKIDGLEEKINNFDYKEENEKKSLMDMIKELRDKVDKVKENYRLNIIQEEVDMNTVNNLDKLEKAIFSLEEVLDKCVVPIEREDRISINKIFNKIEKEIRFLEKEIVHYKEEDANFKEKLDRLNLSKEKMDKLRSKYSEKCPFRIKAYKSAGNFYKKHNKMALFGAGLASMAITLRTVLTVPLIVANEILASSMGKVGVVFKRINDVLIYLSGVKREGDSLVMANGLRIDSTAVTSSLLKSLAVNGVELKQVFPVIDSIKKLNLKMKINESKEKLVNKYNESKEKIVDKYNESKVKVNMAAIERLNRKKELIEKEIEKRSNGGRK